MMLLNVAGVQCGIRLFVTFVTLLLKTCVCCSLQLVIMPERCHMGQYTNFKGILQGCPCDGTLQNMFWQGLEARQLQVTELPLKERFASQKF